MRKIAVTLVCVVTVVVIGYLAVQAQGPGSRAAKKAAVELTASQGGALWITRQLVAQRPSFVARVVQLTGLEDKQAGQVTDEVFIPELLAHVGETEGMIEAAWAASFSAHDLHTLQRCWLLFRYVEMAKVEDINHCEASHAAKKLATERPVINTRIKEDSLSFGSKWFAVALSRHREQLRAEGIVVTKSIRL